MIILTIQSLYHLCPDYANRVVTHVSGTSSLLSRVSELSFLPLNRPRPASSATQLSSIRGQLNDVCVAMQAGTQTEEASPASDRAIFIGGSSRRPTTKTRKTDTMTAAACQ